MKKLLILLLALSLPISAFATRKVERYTGDNYAVPTIATIATALGVSEDLIRIRLRDKTECILVIVRKKTAANATALDALMVTTHGLVKK